MPVHSPRLWPAIASGAMPAVASARASRRPSSNTPAPRRSSTWADWVFALAAAIASATAGGGGTPSAAATSSALTANVASTPGNTNASVPPSAAKPRGANQMSDLPRHGWPRSSTLCASARRSGVGSRTASRIGPGSIAAPPSPARSASIEVPDSASRSWPNACGAAIAVAGAAVRPPDTCAAVRAARPDARAGRSSTRWALIPPKPNADTAASRAGAVHGSACAITRNRVAASAA